MLEYNIRAKIFMVCKFHGFAVTKSYIETLITHFATIGVVYQGLMLVPFAVRDNLHSKQLQLHLWLSCIAIRITGIRIA